MNLLLKNPYWTHCHIWSCFRLALFSAARRDHLSSHALFSRFQMHPIWQALCKQFWINTSHSNPLTQPAGVLHLNNWHCLTIWLNLFCVHSRAIVGAAESMSLSSAIRENYIRNQIHEKRALNTDLIHFYPKRHAVNSETRVLKEQWGVVDLRL